MLHNAKILSCGDFAMPSQSYEVHASVAPSESPNTCDPLSPAALLRGAPLCSGCHTAYVLPANSDMSPCLTSILVCTVFFALFKAGRRRHLVQDKRDWLPFPH